MNMKTGVSVNTGHELHTRVAELEKENADLRAGLDAAQTRIWQDRNKINDLRAELDVAHQSRNRVVWLARRYCALNRINLAFFLDSEKMLRDARMERDAAQARSGAKSIALEDLQTRLAEYEGENKRWHSFETVQAIVKERDELRAQLDDVIHAIRSTCPFFVGESDAAVVRRYIPELREMRSARDSAIRRLKEREAEYDLQIRAATIGVELVTKMLETYQAEYVKMVECFRAANAAKRTMRAFLFSASERAEQAEADARRFAELVDGGNFSFELQQRIENWR